MKIILTILALIAFGSPLFAQDMTELKLSENSSLTWCIAFGSFAIIAFAVYGIRLSIRGLIGGDTKAEDVAMISTMCAFIIIACLVWVSNLFTRKEIYRKTVISERKAELSKLYENAMDNYKYDSTLFSKKRVDNLERELLSIENQLK